MTLAITFNSYCHWHVHRYYRYDCLSANTTIIRMMMYPFCIPFFLVPIFIFNRTIYNIIPISSHPSFSHTRLSMIFFFFFFFLFLFFFFLFFFFFFLFMRMMMMVTTFLAVFFIITMYSHIHGHFRSGKQGH